MNRCLWGLGAIGFLMLASVPKARAQGSLVGEPAPDFSLRDLENTEVSLKSLRGHVVVLYFWATYWDICYPDMSELDKLSREYKGGPVLVFGVNVGQLPRVVRDFVKKKGYTYPQLVNARGELILAYQATDAPTLVIIDKSGKVIDFVHDEPGQERVRSAVKKAIE